MTTTIENGKSIPLLKKECSECEWCSIVSNATKTLSSLILNHWTIGDIKRDIENVFFAAIEPLILKWLNMSNVIILLHKSLNSIIELKDKSKSDEIKEFSQKYINRLSKIIGIINVFEHWFIKKDEIELFLSKIKDLVKEKWLNDEWIDLIIYALFEHSKDWTWKKIKFACK